LPTRTNGFAPIGCPHRAWLRGFLLRASDLGK
jgi:hypothetical protein